MKTHCVPFVALVLVLATGCASHGPKQPEAPKPPKPTDGVSSYGPDKFRVIYEGTRRTKPERAADFAMLRAADTTLQHGCTHFLILNQSVTMQSRGYSAYGTAHSTVFPNGSVVTSSSGGGQGTITWPHVTLLIQTCTNAQPDALDAAYLQASLFKQYDIDETP